MQRLNDFIAWLYIIATLLLGLVIVLQGAGWYGFRDNIELVVTEIFYSPAGIGVGLGMTMLGLLFLSLRLRARKRMKSISFDNPEGVVTISVNAIEDFIKRVSQTFSQVLELTPKVYTTRNGIMISAKTTIIAGTNVPRLTESIQSSIKAKVQSILGIENIAGVRVHVSKLVTKKTDTAPGEQQEFGFGEERI